MFNKYNIILFDFYIFDKYHIIYYNSNKNINLKKEYLLMRYVLLSKNNLEYLKNYKTEIFL